jgi:hypothetical protein
MIPAFKPNLPCYLCNYRVNSAFGLVSNLSFINLTLNRVEDPRTIVRGNLLTFEPVNAYGKSLLFGMFIILFEPFDQISV